MVTVPEFLFLKTVNKDILKYKAFLSVATQTCDNLFLSQNSKLKPMVPNTL